MPPSIKLISAAVVVTPSRMFSSAAVLVTPSRMLISAPVEAMAVDPRVIPSVVTPFVPVSYTHLTLPTKRIV